MDDITARIANLSPAKRALLQQRLQRQTTDASPKQIISRRANRNLAPLSFAQQRLWFLDQLELNSPFYNISWAVQLSGILDMGVLQRVLDTIVARHEALRTTFVSVDGMPVQVIAESRFVELSVIDLSELPTAEQAAEVQHLLSKEAQRPFDLSTDLMVRTTLLRLSPGEHILLLVLHHIASDGWSMGVLFQELAALYKAFSGGKSSPLPELPIQYVDFAHWQRQWLTEEVLETQLAYWRKQLDGAPPVLELPTDYPRSPVQTFRGASQSLVLSKMLTGALRTLSQREGATLFMTLLAAFKILLSCYSGQEDIIVGFPIAGRNWGETEKLIGFFVNTLVLRTHLGSNPSFRELLGRVRGVTLGAYDHQDLPFEKLVEELQLKRDLSRTPLFQVWFNMLNLPDSRLELSGLKAEPLLIRETFSKFDLTLYVQEKNQQIQLQLVYNADLFAPKRMVEMLDQFQLLLQQIVEHPEERITRFSLVTPQAESLLPSPTQLLSSEWFGAVQTRFSDQARRVPGHLAVVDSQVAWSYTELEERTNQLANYLRKNGIQPQDIVAIYSHRSALLVWAILGVLKAGAAFVVLDSAYPDSRLIDCLGITKPRGWLQLEAAGEIPAALEEFVSTLSCCCSLKLPQGLIALAQELTGYSTNDPGAEPDPDNLAYVAFTSGSTGIPQAILGTHRPLSHFLQWHCQTFELNQSDRFSMLSGLSHDPLLRDIFTPLWLGATLCIPEQKTIETPGQLADWMQKEQVSITHLTPAMGQLLAETTLATNEIPSLRYVFFSGDSLARCDVARIQKLAPSATCVNFYGATETPQAMGYLTIPSPGTQVQKGELASSKQSIPLGKGIADVQLLILNLSQQLAGVGEVGEIYVRTPYLAKGYIGDDELTQQRFIINPFTKTSRDRLYKTGDLARYLPDGNIEFLGRLDHQVKIRGFRIELGEIEAALAQHPAVQQTVVTAREDIPGDKRLVGYVVPHQEQVLTANELRRFLKQKLPDYMVPSTFVLLDTLPLTPNGKVDRRALPVPKQARKEALEETFVAPRNEIELQLRKIWEKELSIQPIGVKDNFFDLGGHSLLAVQLFAQIKKEIGTDLPLATLFQAPTIKQLADLLGQRSRPASSSCLVAIQPGTSKPPFFFHGGATDALHWAKLARRLDPDQPFYALQRPDLGHTQTIQTTVKALAAQCIQEIQSVQPAGPYWLGGHCFGGTVAFEMAQQLQAQGEQVALLALVDAIAPRVLPNSLAFRSQVLLHKLNFQFHKNYQYHLEQLAKQGMTEKFAYLPKQLLQWAKFKAKQMIRNKLFKGKSKNVTGDYFQYGLRYLVAEQRNREAHMSYVPQAYSGPITFFRSSQHPLEWHWGPQFGWDKLASGVEVHVIPNFFGNLPSNPSFALLLTEKLRADSDEAQAGVEVPELNLSVGYRRTSI